MKWARINKGSGDHPEVRCRLEAEALGYGERFDELFAGTLSLTGVKMLLSVAAGRELTLMLLDVK